MNKDTIVQFVGFTSALGSQEFIELWEPYARLLVKNPADILLQEGVTGKNSNRFTYVSQHTCRATDFRFAFMKGKNREHFPEHKARIKQAGGYLPVQFQATGPQHRGDVKVLAFVAHGETGLNFFRGLSFRQLNIYEAYFENCIYSYVMEFFLVPQEAGLLLGQLQARTGVEAALYKACRFSLSSRKMSGSLL